MLRKRADREWEDLRSLVESDPRQAMIVFQGHHVKFLVRVGLWTALPSFLLTALTEMIFGQSSPITTFFGICALASCIVISITAMTTFRRSRVRDRLIQKYSDDYYTRLAGGQADSNYQAWVIEHCLEEEKQRTKHFKIRTE